MYDFKLLIFFLQIGIMLSVALIFGFLTRKAGLPIIAGELAGGIVLGPTVLTYIAPGLYDFIFMGGNAVLPEVNYLIQIGMLFFMFVAGLEVDLSILSKNRKQILATSFAGIIVPFISGMAIALFLPWVQNGSGKENGWVFPLFMGTALSISALPVILKTLMDLDLLKTDVGTIIIGSATINDLIGWVLFSIVVSFATSGIVLVGAVFLSFVKALGITVLVIFLVPKIIRVIYKISGKKSLWKYNYIGVTITLILILAILAEVVGLHPFMIIFVLGASLRRIFTIEGRQVRETMHHIAMDFFAPLFFVSIGMKADFLLSFDLRLVVTVFSVACFGKIIGAGLGAYLAGIRFRESFCIGIGLNSRGAIEIILAFLALDLKIIDSRIFVALVITAIATSVLAGPLLKRILSGNKGGLITNDKNAAWEKVV